MLLNFASIVVIFQLKTIFDFSRTAIYSFPNYNCLYEKKRKKMENERSKKKKDYKQICAPLPLPHSTLAHFEIVIFGSFRAGARNFPAPAEHNALHTDPAGSDPGEGGAGARHKSKYLKVPHALRLRFVRFSIRFRAFCLCNNKLYI